MSEAARPATSDDLPSINAILERHRPDLVEQRGGAIYLVAEGAELQSLEAGLDNEQSVSVVGTYSDAVFGVATMRFVHLADGQLIGRIERLVVDAEARTSGIGEAMMNSLLAACAERECTGIEAVALPGDRHTKNFFESFGLKARMLTVMRAL